MWKPTPNQQRFGVLAFGVFAIGLFLWLFMRSRNVAAVSVSNAPIAESAQVPATGNNIYAINFPATEPSTLPGTNIFIGGTSIGSNCGCCDNGDALVPSSTVNQNLSAVAGGDDVLLSMLANIQPTGQSDLGYAFQGL